MKKETIKTLKRVSREMVSSGSLRGNILLSKKKKLIEKILDSEKQVR